MILPKTITPEMSRHAHDITAFFAGAHVDQIIELAFEAQPHLKEAYDHLGMDELIFRFDIFDTPSMMVRIHHMLGIFRSAMLILNEDVNHLSDEAIDACLSVYEHLQSEDPALFHLFDFGWVSTLDIDLMRDEFEAGLLSYNHRLQIKELYRLILALSIQFINDYEEDYQLTLPHHEPTSLN
ncbi:MAG: hypothetical protein KGZ38_00945 [Erysipelothrix sp.]|nr:hypothetical protein [Erysipelothrix sp.]